MWFRQPFEVTSTHGHQDFNDFVVQAYYIQFLSYAGALTRTGFSSLLGGFLFSLTYMSHCVSNNLSKG